MWEGLTPRKNRMPSKTKSMKVLARLYASKKPKEKILTVFTLKDFVQGLLISLPFHHLLVPQGAWLQSGIADFLKALLFKLMLMLLLLSLFANRITSLSMYPIYMVLLILHRKWDSSLGLWIWIALNSNIGYLLEISTFIGTLKTETNQEETSQKCICSMSWFHDIPFSGRNYTWSNMQSDPLLVKLDWVFTSSSWATNFPATFVQPLSKPVSNHIPYTIHIGSNIPKSNSFRFENYWVELPGFYDTIALHWNNSTYFANAAKNLSSRLK